MLRRALLETDLVRKLLLSTTQIRKKRSLRFSPVMASDSKAAQEESLYDLVKTLKPQTVTMLNLSQNKNKMRNLRAS